jgi:hypothetical protein
MGDISDDEPRVYGTSPAGHQPPSAPTACHQASIHLPTRWPPPVHNLPYPAALRIRMRSEEAR